MWMSADIQLWYGSIALFLPVNYEEILQVMKEAEWKASKK